jgi:four helix bundle protein
MAMRSASELDYQLILARDLGFIAYEAHQPLENELSEVKRILNALIWKVRSDVRNQRTRRRATS